MIITDLGESHARSRRTSKFTFTHEKEKQNALQKGGNHMRAYRLELAVSLFLIVVTFAAFSQVLNHDFINFDDDDYVTENPHVQAGLTQKTLAWAFAAFHSNNWHPLTWLSHALDCQLFGLNPGMHHLTNLLIHIANSILLFLLFRRMTRDLWPSALVAALFALHPLHVESVAWIAERKDMLGGFFWMSTLLAYLRYAESPQLTRYLPVLILFAMGLMAKPMLVTLPCVLLLTDYWPLGRVRGERQGMRGEGRAVLLWEKLPLFALAAASSVVTVMAQKSGGLVRSLDMFPLGIRIGNALVSYASYIGKMLWPLDLAFYYPHPGTSLPGGKIALAGLFLAGISFLIVRSGRRHPYLVVGWLWYLGTLVPVIGLVQVASQAMADRYTYIPFIGLFVMMAWGIPALAGEWRHRRPLFATLATLILLGCTVCTWLQVRHWKDSITLFAHTLSVTEENYLANNSLGAALQKEGRINEAIPHLSEAIRIKPDGVQAHYNMGVALDRQGDTEGAIRHFSEAVRLKPDFADAHYNLGIALKRQGNLNEAVRCFSAAVRVNPDFAEAHNNLGSALKDQGNAGEAITHYRKALTIRPDYAEAHNNLGTALKIQGKQKAAIRHYYQALRMNPELAEAHFNVGVALGTQGKHEKAAGHFSEALRIRPQFAEAHYSMGVALRRLKQTEDAMRHYQAALEIRPDFAEVHFNMGVLLAGQGKFDDASDHFSHAVKIKPDYANAHNNLGTVLARMGKYKDAATHFSEAVRLRPDFPDAQRNLAAVLELIGGKK